MWIWASLLVFVLLAGLFLLFLWAGHESPESLRLHQLTAADDGRESSHFALERLATPLAGVRRLFGSQRDPQLLRRLMLAGYRRPAAADLFQSIRLVLPVLAAVAVSFWVSHSLWLWLLLAVVVSLLLPDLWLNRAILRRRERIRLALPDALDLLSICMEAGLGLDQAMLRVAQEIVFSHPDLSQEWMLISLEQSAGVPRLQAWRNMSERVHDPGTQSFVNMLVYTERFGTPVSRALATYADALRTQRRQKAEELGAKTTIKLVVPLVLFIFPSIFIVTIAPAVINIMKGFAGLRP